jgi:hypothetical protein
MNHDAPPPSVLLHLGVHKTATTSIQEMLWQGVDLMAQRRIGLMPRHETAQTIGFGDRLVTTPKKFQRAFDAFRADPALDTLVISHEDVLSQPFVFGTPGLYPHAEQYLTVLRSVTGPGRVVVTLRPQHAFIESWYLQHIHTGGSMSFQAYVGQLDLDDLSWRPLVAAMDRLWGRDNVVVLDFEVIRQGQEVFVQHFLDSTGIDLGLHPGHSGSHNRSLSERGLQMARAVNPLLDSADHRRKVRDFLQRRFSNADYPRARLFEEDQRAEVGERYFAEYRELVDRPGAPPVRPYASLVAAQNAG